MKRIALLGLAIWLCSASSATLSATALVVLAVDIGETAVPGDPVQFMDRNCSYVGEFVREPGRQGLATALVDTAGADAGKWHVRVSKRACGEVLSDVALRVDLPRPPSLAGGGGIPPLPRGYRAGAPFELQGR